MFTANSTVHDTKHDDIDQVWKLCTISMHFNINHFVHLCKVWFDLVKFPQSLYYIYLMTCL